MIDTIIAMPIRVQSLNRRQAAFWAGLLAWTVWAFFTASAPSMGGFGLVGADTGATGVLVASGDQARNRALRAALLSKEDLMGKGWFTAPTDAKVAAELECLALNIYFEARGESDTGKVAVGHVVMNRVSSKRFPKTICGVVQQGGEIRRHRCQFSWWCDGQSDAPADQMSWEKSVKVAQEIFWGLSDDPTKGALWYHADYVKPFWRRSYERGPKIGRHIFYRQEARQAKTAQRQTAKS